MAITIACSRNPLTDALMEPGFGAPEFDIDHQALPVMELFAKALSGPTIDVVEFSLANHVMAVAAGDDRYVGLPVFSFRGFRHSMLWVRSDSSIEAPGQLKGKRIGIAAYALTALVYVRGLLADEYGVLPEEVEWVRTGRERVAFAPPPGVTITDAGTDAGGGRSLFRLLRDGDVDAIVTFWSPDAQADGVRRLVGNVMEVEKNYFRRTGVYPIMHCFALSRRLYERDPGIGARLIRLFERAKARWEENLAAFGAESASVTPWTPLDLETSRALIGADLYPYGTAANERTLETVIRYLREQHLIARPVAVREAFPVD